ncbi:MAG: hypothetical protein B7O98_04075 [Zestosphaera tikiterensis]|uniref:Uncharacterized protein n=1 Tax=Zestosphaera tikiterensis TaxID=1973259 RepID=A0A2R7Y9S0_9CREN|nr:MAG: hypothetical protein B7O98_04075 [Zestosphaera tikiterensis]
MLKAQRQAIYLVRKGVEEIVVEHYRTPDGKSFVVVHKSLEGSYETSEGDVKEWKLLELEDFKEVKDAAVDFETLPPEIRKAVSLVYR